MSHKNVQEKIDSTSSLLTEWERNSVIQDGFMQDIESELLENFDNLTFSKETLKNCADTSQKTDQEEELFGELLHKAQDTGATVDAIISRDLNALSDILINTHETQQSLVEILRALLQKCCEGENMFSEETLRGDIDSLSNDIDAIEREVASCREINEDRKSALYDNYDQGSDRTPYLTNELRDLYESSAELEKTLLVKENNNSDLDKELKEFLQ